MQTKRNLASILGFVVALLVMMWTSQATVDALLYYSQDMSRETLLRFGLIAGTIWMVSLIAVAKMVHKAIYKILTGETYVGKK